MLSTERQSKKFKKIGMIFPKRCLVELPKRFRTQVEWPIKISFDVMKSHNNFEVCSFKPKM